MSAIGFPLVSTVSERIKYAQLANQGLSIFDKNSKELIAMQNQWMPLLEKVWKRN
jgi:chromosome partitioning protein